MTKVEKLRSKLNAVREDLNSKGFKYDKNNIHNYDIIEVFEDNYKRCVENVYKDDYNKVVENYDIFEAMCDDTNEEQVIDEIVNHISENFLNESITKSVINGCTVEEGHTLSEYMLKYGKLYDDGELWDFSEEDFTNGAIEPDPDMIYWKIIIDNEPRYYEVGESRALESLKEDEDTIEVNKKLTEGTSNFPTRFPHGFPLLVFCTYDEVYDSMKYAEDYPQEVDFEDDKGIVDYDAYEDARNTFEEKYWDNLYFCALDEDEIERLENVLYDFNNETKDIAIESDVVDGYQQYSDKLNLEDVELTIEPGYYSAAYIDVKNEDYLDAIKDEEFRNVQIERIKNFMSKLQKDFGLSHLEVAYGPALNGETGYRKVEESVKEDEVAREEYCVMIDSDNYDCFDDEIEAIKCARNLAQDKENRDANVRVLLVKYGSKNKHGDEPELGIETIWAVRFNESLDEDVNDYYVLTDGNPKHAQVYDKIDDVDDFISKLEANKEGKPWHVFSHFVNHKEKILWDSEKGRVDESKNQKKKYHVSISGDSEKSMNNLNAMLDAGSVPTGSLSESDDKKVSAKSLIKFVSNSLSKSDDSLKEASSALKKAFTYGDEDTTDLIQGKAIARIKDPKAREAAIAAKKAGRDDVVKSFIGDRKEDQARINYEKKASKMQKAGMMKESKEFTTIEDAFKNVSKLSEIFDDEGHFQKNIYEKYAQLVADEYFNGNIDKLDAVCNEENCFAESLK